MQADAAASASRAAGTLKGSLAVLNTAGRELNKVARRHAIRFVKQNSTLASQVRDDVSALARSTFTTLTKSAREEGASSPPPQARAQGAPRKPTDRPPVAGPQQARNTRCAPFTGRAVFCPASSPALSRRLLQFKSPAYGSPLYSVVSSGQQTFQEP